MQSYDHWTFTSTVTAPNGMTVTTTCDIPGSYSVDHVRDVAELTEVATWVCAKKVAKSLRDQIEKTLF